MCHLTNAYYVPVKFGNRQNVMLLDSGCTQSVVPRDVLEDLPSANRSQIGSAVGTAILANGERIGLDGKVTLEFRLGQKQFEHEFLIAKVDNHILLGLDFLEYHDCHIDFRNARLQVGTEWVACCTSEGAPLVTKVQAKHTTVIPGNTEKLVMARLNRAWTQGPACVEGTNNAAQVMVATSLHAPTDQDLVIRLMNPTDSPVTIKAGQLVARCTAVDLVSTDQPTGSQPELPAYLQEHMQEWGQHLTTVEQQKLENLLQKHQDVFSSSKFDVGRTNVNQHEIPITTGTRPIKQRPYRHGPAQEEEIEKQVQELKEHGLIKEGHGAWSSPVVLVKKKDNSWRFCVDYRLLNEVTTKDAYPLPRIDDSLDALGGSKLFSTLDLTSGYWQVELEESAKEKAAFVTRSGLWEWEVLPFGLCSAPSTFERLMETVLRGLHWKTLLIYLDDIIVFSKDFDTHLERLAEVFSRLRQAGLKLKPSKCTLLAQRVQYLGHVVSSAGVETDEEKVRAVRDWPTPRHKKDVRAFLGTCGYYRRFIAKYSEISRPLSQLSSKHTSFKWDEQCQAAFDALKARLTEAPILAYPEYSLPFILDTDASHVGTGAVLSQVQDGREHVVSYYSKMFTPEEGNYCVTRKELLAIVKAVKHFRHQLYGRKFTVRTDHASLAWLLRNPAPSGQLARWIEILSEFEYELMHRKGLKHSNVDGLSRRVCLDCKQCERLAVPSEHKQPHIASLQKSALAQNQQQDDQIGPVYQAMTEGTPVDPQQVSWVTKRLAESSELLKIGADGTMCIKLPGRPPDRPAVAVCPSAQRHAIISAIHGEAHLGFNKTLSQVKLKWYWPGMTSEIRRYVASCQECQQAKQAKHKTSSEGNHLRCGRPWQVVAVDLCGPFPETSRGNVQILVLADHFTRWCDAIAIPDGKAETVARVLDERVFCYFGIPEVIHSDQGSQFESALFAECCKLWNCKKTRTSPYHPQGNSVVERLNRTLGNSLRALLCGSEHKEWDELLPQIMRAIRASPHRVTKETANYMMLGRETNLPDSLLTAQPPQAVYSEEDYVSQLQNKMAQVGRRLREEQWALRTPDSEEPATYQAGEKVWLKSYFSGKGKGAKLQAKYVGPYTITKVLPYQTYEMESKGKRSIQHEGRIRLHVAEKDKEASSEEDSHPAQAEATVETDQSSKRVRRIPAHLQEYYLDHLKVDKTTEADVLPILGQNQELGGGGVVKIANIVVTKESFPPLPRKNNSSKQCGGPEKGRCGWTEPVQTNWMSFRGAALAKPSGSFGSTGGSSGQVLTILDSTERGGVGTSYREGHHSRCQ